MRKALRTSQAAASAVRGPRPLAWRENCRLVDPETNAILKPLYDAESTSGHLIFSDGEETTVVWTRMSGADGALMGEAILSDGEVLALTIERAAQETANRSFVLFAAAPPSLVRGTCASAALR